MALGTTAVTLTHRNIDTFAAAPPQSPVGVVPFSVKVNLTWAEISTADTEIPVFKFPTGAKIPAAILGSLGGLAGTLDTGGTAVIDVAVKEADGTLALAWEDLLDPTDILSGNAADGYLDVGGKYLMLGVQAAGTTAIGASPYVHVYGLICYGVFTHELASS